MLLQDYLTQNHSSIKEMHDVSGIPESTLRGLSDRSVEKWSMEYFDALARTINKDKYTVMREVESIYGKAEPVADHDRSAMEFNIENRRYIGSKAKLMSWISQLIADNTTGNSFFDVFAGTGIVSKVEMPQFKRIILNDFLFSNFTIFKAFFGNEDYRQSILQDRMADYQGISTNELDDDYFVDNYGGRFFSKHDARVIGEIRERINEDTGLKDRERDILLASLLYSADRAANTVGHYDAYRKIPNIADRFQFHLIRPLDTEGKEIEIYRADANELVKSIAADVAFIDPPYNSRQYSRFYHVLEQITKWNKPQLNGVAMKPAPENVSEYSKSDAPEVFDNLVQNLRTKYIVVTYNNTYNSKSSSSRNKITHAQILESLNKRGQTKAFEVPYQYFNAGKTDLKGHKEFVFITEVR